MSEAIERPIPSTLSTELARVAKESGLTTADAIADAFKPYADEAAKLIAAAEGVNVSDATQVTKIKQSRALRLSLASVRVAADKTRKALKEDSLKVGGLIQGIYGIIEANVKPIEARLLEQEQFAERAEAKRKEAVKASRSALLAPFVPDVTMYPLGDLDDAAWSLLFDGARLAHEKRLADAAKAEADRIAAEAARIEDEKRVRAENERLRLEAVAAENARRKEREAAEAQAREEKAKADAAIKAERERAAKVQAEADAKARAERERIEAEARKEREAREKLEREAEARRKAEKAKADADAKAARIAAAAPDKDKLIAWAKEVIRIPCGVTSPEAKDVLTVKYESLCAWARSVEELAETLGGA